MIWLRSALMVMVPLMLQAGPAFDPVKDVPVSVSEGVLTVIVPPGVHLNTRPFQVTLVSKGTLQLGTLPAPNGQNEAGDPIWRGAVKVSLKGAGLESPAWLVITYQPCSEGPDGVCFLPVKRRLAVPVSEIPFKAP